jgi:hypothetical protein
VAGEEGHGEGQHENARYAYRPGPVKQLVNDEVPDARAAPALVNRDGAQLGQVVPHYVERAASDYRTVSGRLGDSELKDVFVKVHRVLVEQAARVDVLVDESADFRDIPRARLPHYVLHRGTTVALNYNRTATPGIGTATGMLRLATAPSLSGVTAAASLPQSGQSAQVSVNTVIKAKLQVSRLAAAWLSNIVHRRAYCHPTSRATRRNRGHRGRPAAGRLKPGTDGSLAAVA